MAEVEDPYRQFDGVRWNRWDGAQWVPETEDASPQAQLQTHDSPEASSDGNSVRSDRRSDKQAAKEAEKAAKDAADAEKSYRESPVGQAETAHADGAGFFQIEIALSAVRRSPWKSSYQGYSVSEKRGDLRHLDTLSAIEAVGWRLEHVGYVYVTTGQISRDKMFSSGQEVGVMGETRGIYLFRRSPS